MGTCRDYTGCSAGACSSVNYNDVCTSATQLTEYYNSGASCPSKTYTCTNFEVLASDSDGGDNPSSNGQCTSGTSAGCSSGAFSTSPGTGGGSDQCIGTCGTGTNSCVYREFYPFDSGDGCLGADSCTSKDYDADTNSNTCQSCAGINRWSLGGIANCCGDDSSENVRTVQCDGYACPLSSSGDACCDQLTDCVWSNTCYSSGAAHPTQAGAACSSGTWRDITAPDTVINPDGGDFTGSNETTFTLACSDTGGAGCGETRYRIVDDGQQGTLCTAYGNLDRVATTWPVTDKVTCPFGQICNKRVCFASRDNAGNTEAMNVSGIFHLETNACQGRVCGQTCLFTPGVCPGPNLACYPNGGCLLNCTVPSPPLGSTRTWNNANCGRTGVYKCGVNSICSGSLTSCTLGGSSTQVTGDWTSYTYPSGSYGVGGTFQISLGGVTRSPAGFTILSECLVAKSDGSKVTFNNWGTDVTFQYTVQAGDPEGVWTVDYCGLWSDFLLNSGWSLKSDNTDHQFTIDKSPPSITINNPRQNDVYNVDFTVSATVTDTYSAIDRVYYRWQNASGSGPWTQMTLNGAVYTANFDIDTVADGVYSISVIANDSVGNSGSAVVNNVRIDRVPPDITIFSPVPGWYRSDFAVTAKATDSQGVDTVRYRWENAGGNGAWTRMTLDWSGNYTASFSVTSVPSGNYTFRIWVNDTMGNIAQDTVSRVGIDYTVPTSVMTKPWPPGSFIMSPKFNISWSGSDAHSGIKCYYVTFWYCDQRTGLCADSQYNISFPGGQCTSLVQYEFDTSKETFWISDPNNYTFFFKSLAVDNAGNMQAKAAWDTNVTIYIPKLVTFSATENTTKANIRNGGKVANNRVVIISAKAKPDVAGNLNITVYYTNHTLGAPPTQWSSTVCRNVRECNASIAISVSESEVRKEVDYYIYAENSTQMSEYLPPNAPTGYFYYTVYNHSICNFLVINEFRTLLGSSDLIALEVRNINDRFDNVTLQLLPSMGRFLETNNDTMNIVLLPQEEKIIYARIVASANDFPLTVVGASEVDLEIRDEDTIQVVIGFPPNFYELSDAAAIVLVLLAGLIYLKFVSKKR